MNDQLPQSTFEWVNWKEKGYLDGVYPTACSDFSLVDYLVKEEKEINLLDYAKHYKSLPILPNLSLKEDAPSIFNLSECKDDRWKDAWQLLQNLDKLRQNYPFATLKLTIILLAINQHRPKLSIGDLAILFEKCLQDERLDNAELLKFIVQCNKKAAHTFRDSEIRLLLTSLIIRVTKEDSIKGITLFEKGCSCTEFPKISGMIEGNENFLEFAELVKNERPFYYTQALLKILEDGNLFYGITKHSDNNLDKTKNVANQLYRILTTPSSSHYIDPELLCRTLILCAPTDEPWFQELPKKLLEIEKNKLKSNCFSKRNCFLIVLNCQEDQSVISETVSLYHKLVRDYHQYSLKLKYAVEGHSYPHHFQYFQRSQIQEYISNRFASVDLLPIEFINHLSEVFYAVADVSILDESSSFVWLRNRNLPTSKDCPLIKDSLQAYWEIVDFLSIYNKQACLYVLAILLVDYCFRADRRKMQNYRNGTSIADYYESSELGLLAEPTIDRLIKEFLAYSRDNLENSVLFLRSMIAHSLAYNFDRNKDKKGKPIDYVLDAIYPMIEARAPELAIKAINDTLDLEYETHCGYAMVWKPENWARNI